MKRIVEHEKFNKTFIHNYDYSLLQLTEPLRFDETKQMIHLPNEDEKFPDGMLCSVSGWGDTENLGEQIYHLRRVEVLIIMQVYC